MVMRVHPFLLSIVFVATPCHAGKPVVHDGSAMQKAIRLKQRGSKAVEEEMAWMMKLHRYTPILATRDAVNEQAAEVLRRFRAGEKRSTVSSSQPFEHAMLDHDGQICSYWSFRTRQGKRKAYFDTGVSISIPGELARQESYRAEYIHKYVRSLPNTIW
jgi:hypothetical protein